MLTQALYDALQDQGVVRIDADSPKELGDIAASIAFAYARLTATEPNRLSEGEGGPDEPWIVGSSEYEQAYRRDAERLELRLAGIPDGTARTIALEKVVAAARAVVAADYAFGDEIVDLDAALNELESR